MKQIKNDNAENLSSRGARVECEHRAADVCKGKTGVEKIYMKNDFHVLHTTATTIFLSHSLSLSLYLSLKCGVMRTDPRESNNMNRTNDIFFPRRNPRIRGIVVVISLWCTRRRVCARAVCLKGLPDATSITPISLYERAVVIGWRE